MSLTDATDTATTSVAYSASDGNAVTLTDEATWTATPVVINAGEAGQDNISAIVAFGGSKVGIYYTDKHASGTDDGKFSVHTDSADPAVWGTVETIVSSASAVDNQANVKTDGTNVFVVVKSGADIGTSTDPPLRPHPAAATWTAHDVSDVASTNVRPQVAIDPTYNGGVGAAIVVMNDVTSSNGIRLLQGGPAHRRGRPDLHHRRQGHRLHRQLHRQRCGRPDDDQASHHPSQRPVGGSR